MSELESQLDVARLPGREEQLKAQSEQVAGRTSGSRSGDVAPGAEISERSEMPVSCTTPCIDRGNGCRPEARWSAYCRRKMSKSVSLSPSPSSESWVSVIGSVCTVTAARLTSPRRLPTSLLQAEYTPPVIYSNDTRSKLVFMIEAHPAQADASALHPGQPLTVQVQ